MTDTPSYWPQAAIEAAATELRRRHPIEPLNFEKDAKAALQAAAPFMRSAEEYEFLADEVIRLHLKIEQMEALGIFADGIEVAIRVLETYKGLGNGDLRYDIISELRTLADRKPEVKE